MKIGFISDLHTDVNREYPVMDTLAQAAMQQDLDVLAIAGDISESPETTLREVEKLAVVLGTEGDGLAEKTIANCDYTVKIPMYHGVDSLNVAASSAVAFWELRPR